MDGQISIEELITQETAVTVASLLGDAVTTLTTGVSSVWTLITSNVWMEFVVGVSVVSISIGIFKRLLSAARRT